jgi:hypothetical protein
MATATSTSQQQGATLSIPREKIAMRAYEKWCKRGRPNGTDKQDWTEAEIELRAEMSRAGGMPMGATPARR